MINYKYTCCKSQLSGIKKNETHTVTNNSKLDDLISLKVNAENNPLTSFYLHSGEDKQINYKFTYLTFKKEAKPVNKSEEVTPEKNSDEADPAQKSEKVSTVKKKFFKR